MARRVLLDTQYTFSPTTRQVIIPRFIPRERLLLITNVSTNTVIYNFSDPSQTASAYSYTAGNAIVNASTTINLAFNTTSMTSTDKLQITIDEPAELMVPDEAYQDPVGKFRVSTPQALIDTDFEYGLQPTKWETLTLLNNRPSFFVNTQSPVTITNVQAWNGFSNIVVTTTTPPALGTAFLMNDTTFSGANGPFVVDQVVVAGTSFTYTARTPFTGTTGSIYNSAQTQLYSGSFYSNAAYILTANSVSNVAVTFTTNEPHGLTVSDGVYVVGSSATTNAPNGSFQVTTVNSANQFSVITSAAPTGAILTPTIYANPGGTYAHRAFDGGVTFTTGTPAHNVQTIRQTRRYFRYQSGKGLQISTGTILRPSLPVDELSASGTTITVTTKTAHQLGVGVSVTIGGANETAYNGTFVVDQVINANRFTYIANTAPSATPGSGIITASVVSWYGAATRLGMFDHQNGFYFEFDGQILYAVRRKSTDQIGGFVNVTNANAFVTGATINGVTTKFTKQLNPDDFIVIKGLTYRVVAIYSDTLMTVTPPYRGATLSGANVAVVSKTIDIKVPQSQWNMDKCDGTGPSGHTLDLSRMQMYYIDYSWYGAGTVRFGFRDSQGRVFYCHRIVNSNQNYEAYMRSGNLPGRYEVNTFPARANLAANIDSSSTTALMVSSTAGFPPSGVLLVANPLSYEYMYYTSANSNAFLGLTRGKTTTTLASCSTFASNANVYTATSTSTIQPGMYVYGAGIPTNTFVANIYTGATNVIQLTQGATAAATVTLNFQAMGAAAAAHNITSANAISVSSHIPSFSPTISHWGTSVMMDGRFDDDKSLIFIYGENTAANVAPGRGVALMSLRVSPSVDSGVTGTLGQREIINRMQLKLVQADVLVNGSFLITLVLNGTTVAQAGGALGTYTSIATGTSSLAQVADHTGNVSVTGGENIFGFYAVNNAGSTNFSQFQGDLTQLRDLGNSVLGGGLFNTPNTNVYPDGPDVLTVVATNIGTGFANVFARLGWTEAQA